MIRLFAICLVAILFSLEASGSEARWLPVEKQVKEAVSSKDVTVVHFWAPWCANCINEDGKDGWPAFIEHNPDVKFVFIECWNDGKDSREYLTKRGIGSQPNLTLLVHPGPRHGEGFMRTFMDVPVTWLPTTWVYREGRLEFAFNYGEIRFPILQQLVSDTKADW